MIYDISFSFAAHITEGYRHNLVEEIKEIYSADVQIFNGTKYVVRNVRQKREKYLLEFLQNEERAGRLHLIGGSNA